MFELSVESSKAESVSTCPSNHITINPGRNETVPVFPVPVAPVSEPDLAPQTPGEVALYGATQDVRDRVLSDCWSL